MNNPELQKIQSETVQAGLLAASSSVVRAKIARELAMQYDNALERIEELEQENAFYRHQLNLPKHVPFVPTKTIHPPKTLLRPFDPVNGTSSVRRSRYASFVVARK